MTKWNCYIEKYESKQGPAMRLRDSESNKKIAVQVSSPAWKTDFIKLMSTAEAQKENMPGLFERHGKNKVVVCGTKLKENRSSLFVDITKKGSGCSLE